MGCVGDDFTVPTCVGVAAMIKKLNLGKCTCWELTRGINRRDVAILYPEVIATLILEEPNLFTAYART